MIHRAALHFVFALFVFASVLATGAGLNASAQIVTDKPTIPADQEGLLFPIPKFSDPRQEIPAGSCTQAHARAMELLAEIERTILPQVKAEAEKYIANRDRAFTVSKAWDNLAVNSMLAGHVNVAAWAGLNAVKNEWSGQYVTNAGIYLIKFRKCAEGMQLLRCAYSMGFRSPYLLEALSTGSVCIGDNAKAREYIQQAKQMAPEDPEITVEHSLLTTGGPPALPPPGSSDPFEKALRELEEHSRRVITQLNESEDLLERMSQAAGDEYQPPPQELRENQTKRAEGFAQMIETTRSLMPNARLSMTELMRKNPGLPASTYDDLLAAHRNNFFLQCILHYLSISNHSLLFWNAGSDVDRLFWSEVIRMDPLTYAREIKGTRFPPANAPPRIDAFAVVFYNRKKDEAREELQRRERRCVETNNFVNDAAIDACKVRERAAYCRTLKTLYEHWSAQSKQRFELAGRNFENVAQRLLRSGERTVFDGREYTVRTMKYMRFRPSSPQDQVYLQGINQGYQGLMDLVIGDPDKHGGPVRLLRDQADKYRRMRDEANSDLDLTAASLAEDCSEVERLLLEQLAEEKWRAYKQMLLSQIIKDLNFKITEPKCKVGLKVGAFRINIDDSGKVVSNANWEWLKKPFGELKTEGTINGGFEYQEGESFTGTLNGEYTGSVGPFRAKGKASVYNEYDIQAKTFKGGIRASVTPEVGFKKKLGEIAEANVICSPGGAEVDMDPRAVQKSVYKYLDAMQSGPPGRR